MRGVGRLVLVGALVAAVGAASAWAVTIRGTAKANVIHGTAGPDVIYGLGGNDKLYGGAGNDKLYGGAGNDLLVGGPGADLLNCGPGHDTAIAGKGDRVVGCEVVKLLPATTVTTTTAPAPVQFQTGHYCGFTQNGGGICFDITANPYEFTNAAYSVTYDANDCSPTASGKVDYTTGGAAPLNGDGSFDFNITQGESAGTDISGVVDTQGGSTGTLHIHSVFSSGGTTYTCTLDVPWSAKKQ